MDFFPQRNGENQLSPKILQYQRILEVSLETILRKLEYIRSEIEKIVSVETFYPRKSLCKSLIEIDKVLKPFPFTGKYIDIPLPTKLSQNPKLSAIRRSSELKFFEINMKILSLKQFISKTNSLEQLITLALILRDVLKYLPDEEASPFKGIRPSASHNFSTDINSKKTQYHPPPTRKNPTINKPLLVQEAILSPRYNPNTKRNSNQESQQSRIQRRSKSPPGRMERPSRTQKSRNSDEDLVATKPKSVPPKNLQKKTYQHESDIPMGSSDPCVSPRLNQLKIGSDNSQINEDSSYDISTQSLPTTGLHSIWSSSPSYYFPSSPSPSPSSPSPYSIHSSLTPTRSEDVLSIIELEIIQKEEIDSALSFQRQTMTKKKTQLFQKMLQDFDFEPDTSQFQAVSPRPSPPASPRSPRNQSLRFPPPERRHKHSKSPTSSNALFSRGLVAVDSESQKINIRNINEEELVRECTGYQILSPTDDATIPEKFTSNEFQISDTDLDFDEYRQSFEPHQHLNYVGEVKYHPLIVSILRDDINDHVKAMVWTIEGEQIVYIPSSKVKSFISPTMKDKLNALKKNVVGLSEGSFVRVKPPDLVSNLVEYEKKQKFFHYKIGVLFCKDSQIDENHMYSNMSSTKFENFLSFLGEKIKLEGWEHFRGGLDVKGNSTGTHSVFSKVPGFPNYDIMFHVSTLLPYTHDDEQQVFSSLTIPIHVERKRHIGNDIVVIVFCDSDSPWSPETMKSEYNHIYIVVHEDQKNSSNETIYYRVNVICKIGVPTNIEPVLPWKRLSFERNEAFRRLFLTYLINAEKAAYKAPIFKSKLRRTRNTILREMIQPYLE